MMDLKDPGEAILQYRRALSIRPDGGISRMGLAEALDAAGMPGESIEEYQALLGAEPEIADAHNNLGVGFEEVLKMLDERSSEVLPVRTR